MKNTVSFVDAIRETIESGEISLPVFNHTGMKIQEELVKENPDMEILEKTIVTDQALAGLVLQMANSSFYKGLSDILTVRSAIVRLGMREVGRLTLLGASKDQFRSKDKKLNFFMRRLWQHSVGCAMGARWLARRCKLGELESHAFFGGLLHDVGKLLILMVIEQMKQKGASLPMTDALFDEAMISLHTVQGYKLMKLWNMPEPYCVVVRDHHHREYDNSNELLCLVRIADAMCTHLGIGLQKSPDFIVSAMDEVHNLNLSEIDIAEMEIHLEDTSALVS
ncbi:MAG: HDOD domain-containing protein [Thermodesulfobacteriota bacterium]